MDRAYFIAQAYSLLINAIIDDRSEEEDALRFSIIIFNIRLATEQLFCVGRFERERTCPLCRALVKPADLRSFGDGSTSLFFQLF